VPPLYPPSGSPEFCNLSGAARRVLLGDLASSITASSDHGVGEGTHQKIGLAWSLWRLWLKNIDLFDDEYLEAFEHRTRTRLLRVFAAAVRAGRFSTGAYDRLAASTVTGSVDHVAATFVDAGRPDPRHSEAGASSRFLQRIYKSYQDGDDNLKQQKAVTASLLSHMFEHAQRAAAELAISTFFSMMRSCQYVHVSGSRRTKPLCLWNLRFFRDNRVLLHFDPNLASATTLAITFEYQKTDVRDETVHQHSTDLPILCPVRRWAGVVQRILSSPGCDADSPVSTMVANDTRKLVTGAFLGTQLRAAASRIGKDALGFSPEHIGTHSIRSGAEMAMYLAGVPVFTTSCSLGVGRRTLSSGTSDAKCSSSAMALPPGWPAPNPKTSSLFRTSPPRTHEFAPTEPTSFRPHILAQRKANPLQTTSMNPIARGSS
jgi:hypothetical protein